MPDRTVIAESITRQITSLVRISSRAGADDYGPILLAVQSWLEDHAIPCADLRDGDRVVGISGEIAGAHSGPAYLLNATVDTADFGDVDRWSQPPLSGATIDGWLYGRGSADCKAGVAIFCHVLAALAEQRSALHGRMAFLFDADEHSGTFTGVRTFMESRGRAPKLTGVMTGYPGNTGVVIGCRGFFRVQLAVHGVSAHTGSSRRHGVNAIVRAAHLVKRIGELNTAVATRDDFPLPAQVTVTAVNGGTDFSTVPDLCLVNVDVRLTPTFTRTHAEAALRDLVTAFDQDRGESPATDINTMPGWPAYQLDDDVPMVSALRRAATVMFGRNVPGIIAGPSSIGNFLATLGIPTTSGFGVTYQNLHATDECIELASIDPVYHAYLAASRQLLGVPDGR